MPYAIIRGANGRRHEVDFGDAPVRVEIYANEETVEIFIEADFDTLRRNVGASPFSTFPAICLAKPPPQRLDVPRTCPAFLLRWVKLQRFLECDSRSRFSSAVAVEASFGTGCRRSAYGSTARR